MDRKHQGNVRKEKFMDNFRSAVIFFYCANEGISIIENAARIGLPVPEKLTEVMKQLKDK